MKKKEVKSEKTDLNISKSCSNMKYGFDKDIKSKIIEFKNNINYTYRSFEDNLLLRSSPPLQIAENIFIKQIKLIKNDIKLYKKDFSLIFVFKRLPFSNKYESSGNCGKNDLKENVIYCEFDEVNLKYCLKSSKFTYNWLNNDYRNNILFLFDNVNAENFLLVLSLLIFKKTENKPSVKITYQETVSPYFMNLVSNTKTDTIVNRYCDYLDHIIMNESKMDNKNAIIKSKIPYRMGLFIKKLIICNPPEIYSKPIFNSNLSSSNNIEEKENYSKIEAILEISSPSFNTYEFRYPYIDENFMIFDDIRVLLCDRNEEDIVISIFYLTNNIKYYVFSISVNSIGFYEGIFRYVRDEIETSLENQDKCETFDESFSVDLIVVIEEKEIKYTNGGNGVNKIENILKTSLKNKNIPRETETVNYKDNVTKQINKENKIGKDMGKDIYKDGIYQDILLNKNKSAISNIINEFSNSLKIDTLQPPSNLKEDFLNDNRKFLEKNMDFFSESFSVNKTRTDIHNTEKYKNHKEINTEKFKICEDSNFKSINYEKRSLKSNVNDRNEIKDVNDRNEINDIKNVKERNKIEYVNDRNEINDIKNVNDRNKIKERNEIEDINDINEINDKNKVKNCNEIEDDRYKKIDSATILNEIQNNETDDDILDIGKHVNNPLPNLKSKKLRFVKKKSKKHEKHTGDLISKKQLFLDPINNIKGTIWEKVSNYKINVDIEEFESLFCVPVLEKKRNNIEEPDKPNLFKNGKSIESITLLNSDRIFFASLALKHIENKNINADIVEDVILKREVELNVQDYKNISTLILTKEEYKLLELKNNFYSEIEEKMVKFYKIPHLKNVLFLKIYELNLIEEINTIEKNLITELNIFTKIEESEGLKIFLKGLLDIGNLINDTYSLNKISIDGFKLKSMKSILSYCGDKNNNLLNGNKNLNKGKNSNLIKYHNCGELLSFILHTFEKEGIEYKNLIKDLKIIETGVGIDIDNIRNQINEQITLFKENLIIYNSLSNKYREHFKRTFVYCSKKLRRIKEDYDFTHKKINKVKNKFGESIDSKNTLVKEEILNLIKIIEKTQKFIN